MVAEANKYLSDQAPWKLRETDPDRMGTILHVALQVVDDGKTLLTPFLPQLVAAGARAARRRRACWAGMPSSRGRRGRRAGLPGPDRRLPPRARWESVPSGRGRRSPRPTPLFAKLDPSVVDEELARMAAVT